MKKSFNVAIVGATGLVGRTMLQVLEERYFPINNLKLLASERSAGQNLLFRNEQIVVEELGQNSFRGIDIALFSAGSYVSKTFVPIAARVGCIVIDNGSYWRMKPDVPLIVPEVNPNEAFKHEGIITNPNCSTIQLVVALKPLLDNYGLRRVIVSTYQSISGAGQKGINKLISDISSIKFCEAMENWQLSDNKNIAFPRRNSDSIAFNTAFHEPDAEKGFSVEEIKMMNETRKILNIPDLKISVTCVRLPILGGHGESVNVELSKPFTLDDIREVYPTAPGIVLMDDFENGICPTVAKSESKDEVLIGRLRLDSSCENSLNLWITADNLRKGAATNAVQIAELFL